MSKPFLPSGRALIKEVGLIPARIAEQPDAVRDTLRRASRGRLSVATINGLLEKAAESIGIGYAEAVINEELHSSMELIENIEEQICSLDTLIVELMENRNSPLPSLGILRGTGTVHLPIRADGGNEGAYQQAGIAASAPCTLPVRLCLL